MKKICLTSLKILSAVIVFLAQLLSYALRLLLSPILYAHCRYHRNKMRKRLVQLYRLKQNEKKN